MLVFADNDDTVHKMHFHKQSTGKQYGFDYLSKLMPITPWQRHIRIGTSFFAGILPFRWGRLKKNKQICYLKN